MKDRSEPSKHIVLDYIIVHFYLLVPFSSLSCRSYPGRMCTEIGAIGIILNPGAST